MGYNFCTERSVKKCAFRGCLETGVTDEYALWQWPNVQNSNGMRLDNL